MTNERADLAAIKARAGFRSRGECNCQRLVSFKDWAHEGSCRTRPINEFIAHARTDVLELVRALESAYVRIAELEAGL